MSDATVSAFCCDNFLSKTTERKKGLLWTMVSEVSIHGELAPRQGRHGGRPWGGKLLSSRQLGWGETSVHPSIHTYTGTGHTLPGMWN